MTANGRAKFSWGAIFPLLKQTFNEWLEDKAPQLGAALAYYTVFSLAPLILLLLTIVGVLFRSDPSGAWTRITEQMGYFLDKSALDVVQQIAQKAAQSNKNAVATIIGIALALFGASGVFGQLQDARTQPIAPVPQLVQKSPAAEAADEAVGGALPQREPLAQHPDGHGRLVHEHEENVQRPLERRTRGLIPTTRDFSSHRTRAS